MSNHESFIVRLKSDASDADVDNAVKHFESQGGQVSHRHTLFKGFSGSIPSDKVSALDSIANVESVEKDGKVSIQ